MERSTVCTNREPEGGFQYQSKEENEKKPNKKVHLMRASSADFDFN